MTKKQFEWLKDHQPFEITSVESYDDSKWAYCCHITSVTFDDERLIVKGVKHHYTKNGWKQEHYVVRIHRKNIKKVCYHKGEFYERFYNTV